MDAGAVGAEEIREVDDVTNIRTDRVRRCMRLLEMDDPVTKTLDGIAVIIQYRP